MPPCAAFILLGGLWSAIRRHPAPELADVLMSLGVWDGRAGRMRVLNHGIKNPTWTVERLRRTVRRLAIEGMIEPTLLGRARRQGGDDQLVGLVAGIKAAAPDRTLQQIASQFGNMRERTPRGGTRWHPPRSNTC